ncbi:MAG TPA: hypothetical protein DDW52_28605 [Planctomycetaceae bacterium]|nr:hypothetical protein [Planctomycetaceae bacterium]
MKLLQFSHGDSSSQPGLLTRAGVVSLSDRINGIHSLLDVISAWDECKESLGQIGDDEADFQLDEVRVDCPVPPTVKTLCIGLNYRDHALESGMEIPSEPVVFNKLPGALCSHESVVELPSCSEQVDYEAEMVIVIGRRAHGVTEETAEEHIFGYACGHDVSARDWQIGRPGGQWLLGKSFPGFAPLGPFVVPRSSVADANNLSISLRLNGKVLQNSSTRQLIFNPVQLVAYLSQCMVLEPGDVIFTGTPPGVGMARNPKVFLQPGDVAEVEVEGLGVLRNTFALATASQDSKATT